MRVSGVVLVVAVVVSHLACTQPAGFSPVANLSSARGCATATLLPDGRVLVAGGASAQGVLASAELFDPATGAFSPTGALNTARSCAAAAALSNGQVLIVGGGDAHGVLASAELYDPSTGSFTVTGGLSTARRGASATLLRSGLVLVAGGQGATPGLATGPLASAELYDPSTGIFSVTEPLLAARYQPQVAALSDGRVLFAGGRGLTDAGADLPLASAELFDGVGRFSATAQLAVPRFDGTATTLPDGRVLVAGGASGIAPIASAELFDPGAGDAGTFGSTGPLLVARRHLTATLLRTGRVLLAGGLNGVALSSAELFDLAAGDAGLGGFVRTAGDLATARQGATATLLQGGQVLLVGGASEDGGVNLVLSSAELYSP